MSLLEGTLRKILTSLLFLTMLLGSPLSFGAASNALGHQLRPDLGESGPVVDQMISTDGPGLPMGVGSVAEGRLVYENRCMACHGKDGRQRGNELVGGIGSLATARPLKTVGSYWPYATTLFGYIAKAMPYNEQKSLSSNEVYSVTAYILNLNDILPDQANLDQTNLAEVRMPNRDGFIELIP